MKCIISCHSKIKQAAGWPSDGQWPSDGHFAFAIGGPLPSCHLPMALVQWPSNGLADKRPVQAHFLLPFRWQFPTKATALPLANGHAASKQVMPTALLIKGPCKPIFYWPLGGSFPQRALRCLWQMAMLPAGK